MSNQMRRLMRRMGAGGNQQTRGGLYLPQGAYSPEDEQDRRRDALAERLLEVGLDQFSPCDFSDTAVLEVNENEPQVAITEWFRKAAHAALAAAEVIYPDLPSEPLGVSQPLPAAAQEGARTVTGMEIGCHAAEAAIVGRETFLETGHPITSRESALDAAGDVHQDERPIRGEG